MRRAIVVGSAGQDGSILVERLTREGCAVLGVERSGATLDILDRACVLETVRSFAPDEVYYLAAHHGSSESARVDEGLDRYEASHAVHVRGLLHFLEALRVAQPRGALFYAASSRVFGEPAAEVQDETTPLAPTCVYGITKAAGILCCRLYRRVHGLRTSVGVLYNHESPSRPAGFVSRKIVQGAVDAKRGRLDKLVLADFAARVDWGYAPDFVDAMLRIAALPEGDEFVVATGEGHSVAEFAEIAFRAAGLDWTRYVVEDRAAPVRRRPTLLGDASKLRALTGWKPTVSFEEMIGILWRAAS